MPSTVFQALVIPSLAGAVFAMLLTAVRPLTRKLFDYTWHYYIWLAVLAVMLLPVRFSLPRQAAFNPPAQAMQAAQQAQTADPVQTTGTAVLQPPGADPAAEAPQRTGAFFRQFINSAQAYTGVVWLAGVLLLLSIHAAGYIRLIRRVRRTTVPIPCPELAAYTGKRVAVRTGGTFSSPFIMGVLRPTLVLPRAELTKEQLDYILRHEMTHFQRRDLLYKFFAVFVKCIHWFNPAAWYIVKQIHAECEISCDLSVVRNMGKDEERGYVNTILSLLSGKQSKSLPLTTGMTGSKKMLKRRFIMMKNRKKTSRLMSALSVVAAAMMLSTAVFASGVLSGLAEEDYTIEITRGSAQVALASAPFAENASVYVPLRACLEQAGFDGSNSSIKWENGSVTLAIVQSNGLAGMFRFEIGNNYVGLKHIDAAELHTASMAPETFIMSVGMENAPVLRNAVTYIPVGDLNYILYGFLAESDASSFQTFEYRVFDKNNNDVTAQFDRENNLLLRFNSARLPTEAERMADPSYTVQGFFGAFETGDFEQMKAYCTENFVDQFFGDGYCFGMTTATLTDMSVDPMEYAKSSNDFQILAHVDMTPHEDAVFGTDQTALSFRVSLLRQPDGRYLIDAFGY